MFPFLHVAESLEPMDKKRDQASTVGREQVPAFEQNPAHVYSQHACGKLHTESRKHEERYFATSSFSDITKWNVLPEERESS